MDSLQAGHDKSRVRLQIGLPTNKSQSPSSSSSAATNTQSQVLPGSERTQELLCEVGSQFTGLSDETISQKADELTILLNNIKIQDSANINSLALINSDLSYESSHITPDQDCITVIQIKDDVDSGYRSQSDGHASDTLRIGPPSVTDAPPADSYQNTPDQESTYLHNCHPKPQSQRDVNALTNRDSLKRLTRKRVVEVVRNGSMRRVPDGDTGKISRGYSPKDAVIIAIHNVVHQVIIKRYLFLNLNSIWPISQDFSSGTVCHGSSSQSPGATANSHCKPNTKTAGNGSKQIDIGKGKKRDLDEDDSGEGAGGGSKRHLVKEIDQQYGKLACHFYKKDPRKFGQGTYKTCSKGFEDMGRLKTHLNKYHVLKNVCDRCMRDFSSEQLLSEHVQGDPCDPCADPVRREDNISIGSRREALDVRNPRNGNVEEQWYRIWDGIFPKDKFPHLRRPESARCDICSQWEQVDLAKHADIDEDGDTNETEREDEVAANNATIVVPITRLQQRYLDIFDESAEAGISEIQQTVLASFPAIEPAFVNHHAQWTIDSLRKGLLDTVEQLESVPLPVTGLNGEDTWVPGVGNSIMVNPCPTNSNLFHTQPLNWSADAAITMFETNRSPNKFDFQTQGTPNFLSPGAHNATAVDIVAVHSNHNNNGDMAPGHDTNVDCSNDQIQIESTEHAIYTLPELSGDPNIFGV